MNGIQEVESSILFGSTNKNKDLTNSPSGLFFIWANRSNARHAKEIIAPNPEFELPTRMHAPPNQEYSDSAHIWNILRLANKPD